MNDGASPPERKGNKEVPLLSGLPSKEAVLNPEDLVEYVEELYDVTCPEVPKYCIIGYFKEIYDILEKEYRSRIIHWPTKDSAWFDPIHIFEYKGIDVAYVFPGIGGPNAAAMLEMMIAFGGEYFISVGAVGILTEEIESGSVILPIWALRDEGTSFHYQEPSRYSYPSGIMLESIREALRERDIPFQEGGTWTTDALFRETLEKVKKFYEEGCLSVEMEASTLFSVGLFRKKHVASIFTAGDCVAGPKWDSRRKKGEGGKFREKRREVLTFALDAFTLL